MVWSRREDGSLALAAVPLAVVRRSAVDSRDLIDTRDYVICTNKKSDPENGSFENRRDENPLRCQQMFLDAPHDVLIGCS
jgi:hypothetical protein